MTCFQLLSLLLCPVSQRWGNWHQTLLGLESWLGGRRYPEATKNQMGHRLGPEALPGSRGPEGWWWGRRGRTILSWTVGGGG